MSNSTWIRDYGPALAWFVVAIGWYINNRQSNRREKRKEIRADITEISKSIDNALIGLNDALSLDRPHTSSLPGIPYLKITTCLREIDLQLERLLLRKYSDSCRIHIDKTRDAFEEFFDIISGDDVTDPDLTLGKKDIFRLRAHNSAYVFLDELHKLFLSEFDK